ncbi:copper chaperone PCu(A)C [Jonesia quinghaiensis]|uniref:copper chaperone PCu(A)C n=1 Tax=Jonesia quinghaiensis TaxID=262806 RepID=UPI000405644E|nr:copper chaperone PCu(A)C [Jonesia quinghaiensis]
MPARSLSTPHYVVTAALAATVLTFAGCASPSSRSVDPAPQATVTTHTNAQAITMTDPWVKAADMDSHMTAGFGTLVNDSDQPVVLTEASTSVASNVELHETVTATDGSTTMQEVPHGLTIPAHNSLTLEPGGNHLMPMGLTQDLIAGDTVDITLVFSDTSTTTITAEIRDFDGAQESYEHEETDMDTMSDHTEDDATVSDANSHDDAHHGHDH